MATKDRVTFDVTIDGKPVTMAIRRPNTEQARKAQEIWNTAFSDAVKSKAILRVKLGDFMEEQGLWDTTKQVEFSNLQEILLKSERRLKQGGFSLSEAKKVALDMADARSKMRQLISKRTELDSITADGQADNAKFNYLVSVCLVYDNGNEQYFKNYEDYLNRSGEPVSILAAQNLSNILYGLDSNYEATLPENQFLFKYKFVDDKFRLINKDGKLIDPEGRLIDEFGRFIDSKGNFVDKEGNPVDDAGEYIVDSQPFLDDDGKPIEEPKAVVTTEPTVPVVAEETQPEETTKPTVVKKERKPRVLVETESDAPKQPA